MLLIPAIDVRAGRCVRLYQGDFAAETCYGPDPEGLLRRYQTLGARWLHVVDLDGAKDGARANGAVIAALAALGAVHLQVGGGVRSSRTIEQLLDAGVARVVIGSAALERPDEVSRWLGRFGAQRLCLAFDVRAGTRQQARVYTHGWTQDSSVSLWEAVGRYATGSIRHILCTDIGRDGALTGPNLDLYRTAVARFPNVAWQASGGVRNVADLAELAKTGVAAVLSGKALLEEMTSKESERSKSMAPSLRGQPLAHADSRAASLASYLGAYRSRS
jgi:phosphoribosylformimino-5-aminoimidazole carboxamide ribotide isomerase